MSAAASRIMLKVPIRLMAMTRSKSSSGIGPSRPTMRFAGPDAGAIDQDARRAVLGARLRQRRGGLLGVGDVALHGVTADLLRDRARAVEIDVEAGDLGAGVGELRPRSPRPGRRRRRSRSRRVL